MSLKDRIEHFLNQEVSWEQKTHEDDYGQPTHAESVTIKVRKVGKTRRTTNKQGTHITTNTEILTIDDINVGDKIDSEIVVDTLESVDRDGVVCAKKVYL